MNISRTFDNYLLKTFNYQYKLGIDLSLPIEYFSTIMNKNRQKLVLLGNAKPKCALSYKNFCTFCVHFGMAFFKERL